MTAGARLSQRADYTHKYNAKTGRHGWLRLTPAYSVKIVEDLISHCATPMRILDPFSGTATTPLSAAYHAHEGIATDINPFLVWLGQVKTAVYTEEELKDAEELVQVTMDLVSTGGTEPIPAPPIHNIERWWNPLAIAFLRQLGGAIAHSTSSSSVRNLLLVGFCRTLISISNAAFDHQSMSFKSTSQLSLDLPTDYTAIFAEHMRFVLNGARENPAGTAHVIHCDAKELSPRRLGFFDRVITSPPYANRMSYIRELRPYMYWLGYLANGRDAGELDWLAIGGTWGIATSRLAEWHRESKEYSTPYLEEVLASIAHPENKNGQLLARYVDKYFHDMWQHFKTLPSLLRPGAEIHYIVGNSSFYGTLLSVEKVYAEMLSTLGFVAIECRPIRKRNSKKELLEFDVMAKWEP